MPNISSLMAFCVALPSLMAFPVSSHLHKIFYTPYPARTILMITLLRKAFLKRSRLKRFAFGNTGLWKMFSFGFLFHSESI